MIEKRTEKFIKDFTVVDEFVFEFCFNFRIVWD